MYGKMIGRWNITISIDTSEVSSTVWITKKCHILGSKCCLQAEKAARGAKCYTFDDPDCKSQTNSKLFAGEARDILLRQSRLAQFWQDFVGKALVFATATEAEIF